MWRLRNRRVVPAPVLHRWSMAVWRVSGGRREPCGGGGRVRGGGRASTSQILNAPEELAVPQGGAAGSMYLNEVLVMLVSNDHHSGAIPPLPVGTRLVLEAHYIAWGQGRQRPGARIELLDLCGKT